VTPTPAGLVDAHHHAWDLSVRDQDWLHTEHQPADPMAPIRRDFGITDLEPHAHAAGIDATVLVQTVTDAAETPEFLALADAHELIAGVVGWTDLTAPGVDEAIAGLRDCPGGEYLVGIRHQVQGEADPEWLCRADVRRGLTAVAAAGLVYDLVVLPHQLPAAIATAAALPQLTFVLDHLGKPPIATGDLEPWAASLRALAAQPNVVCKLSGMLTEADWHEWTIHDLRPYADTVLDAFGPDRLMFGSDWPVCLLAAEYVEVMNTAQALTSGLDPQELSAVFGGTARRVYGLRRQV
jgi:L-fuconolactonase